ncbi:hypothetical protein RUND412_001557 [Rhizina undulata]
MPGSDEVLDPNPGPADRDWKIQHLLKSLTRANRKDAQNVQEHKARNQRTSATNTYMNGSANTLKPSRAGVILIKRL